MRLFLYEVTPQNRDSWSIYCNNLHLDQTHHWILKNKYRFSPTSFCHLKQDVRLNHSLQSYTQKKKKKIMPVLSFQLCARECVRVCTSESSHPKSKEIFFFAERRRRLLLGTSILLLAARPFPHCYVSICLFLQSESLTPSARQLNT